MHGDSGELTARPIRASYCLMNARFLTLPILLASSALLAACSGSGLSTASITGQSAETKSALPPAPTAVTDPRRRAIRVAEISARAEKCGFNFDASRLRTNYLASEVQGGLDAAQVAQVTAVYDKAREVTWREVAGDEGYCYGSRPAQVKADLTKVLANDFVFLEQPKKNEQGFFAGLMDSPGRNDRINPGWASSASGEGIVTRKPRTEE